MFSEVSYQLNSSKFNFTDNVNDSFGNSIINDVYEPFESCLQKLDIVWNEAVVKEIEINSLLIELRTIL
jgi:hypothetical protein